MLPSVEEEEGCVFVVMTHTGRVIHNPRGVVGHESPAGGDGLGWFGIVHRQGFYNESKINKILRILLFTL